MFFAFLGVFTLGIISVPVSQFYGRKVFDHYFKREELDEVLAHLKLIKRRRDRKVRREGRNETY